MDKKFVLLLPLLAAVVIAGCVGQTKAPVDTGTTPTEPTTPVEPTTPSDSGTIYEPPVGVTPTMVVELPVDGSSARSSSISYRASVDNFRLGSPVAANQENEGHLDVTLDGKTAVHKTSGSRANEDQPIVITGFFGNLEPGEHTVKFELVNNDHTSLSTPLAQTVKVTLTSGSSDTGNATQ